jgi:hypothetical protein
MDPRDPFSAPPSRATAFFQSAKFGNIIEIVPPFLPLPQYLAPGRIQAVTTPVPLPKVRQPLLEADLTVPELRETSGSWVLSIDTETTITAPRSPSEIENFVCPVVCEVSLGSGGASQVFECDARNQSFQVPAAYIKVVAKWPDSVPPWGWSTAGAGWAFPDKITVRATLQRGYSSGRATRTILAAKLGPSVTTWNEKIPNFARCFRVWGDRTDPFFGTSPTGLVQFFTEIDSLGAGWGPQMLYNANPNLLNPAGVPVPVEAQEYLYSLSSGDSSIYSFEFDLNL